MDYILIIILCALIICCSVTMVIHYKDGIYPKSTSIICAIITIVCILCICIIMDTRVNEAVEEVYKQGYIIEESVDTVKIYKPCKPL